MPVIIVSPMRTRILYETVILAEPSLVGYWRLNEAGSPLAGTTAVDETGSHNGTYQGTPQGGQPSIIRSNGTAVNFTGPGDDDRVEIPSLTTPSPEITVEAWVRTTAVLGGTSAAMISQDTVSSNRNYQFRLSGNNATPQWIIFNGGTRLCLGNISCNDGNPHHVVGTYDGTTMHVYVDGVLDDSTSTTGTIISNTGNTGIGARIDLSSGTSYEDEFIGDLDEVAIYNSALTIDQIQEHYDAGK